MERTFTLKLSSHPLETLANGVSGFSQLSIFRNQRHIIGLCPYSPAASIVYNRPPSTIFLLHFHRVILHWPDDFAINVPDYTTNGMSWLMYLCKGLRRSCQTWNERLLSNLAPIRLKLWQMEFQVFPNMPFSDTREIFLDCVRTRLVSQ